MSAAERDAFLAVVLPEQRRAGVALHRGDPTPWLATWSQDDPVTVLGAAVPVRRGRDDVRATIEWVGSLFTRCDEYDYELLAADVSGDLAYTAGIERYRAQTAEGQEVDTALRVTHVFRRDLDGWKLVHRHGDHLPVDQMSAIAIDSPEAGAGRR
jgi:ketosteroid isomerase-like protein